MRIDLLRYKTFSFKKQNKTIFFQSDLKRKFYLYGFETNWDIFSLNKTGKNDFRECDC